VPDAFGKMAEAPTLSQHVAVRAAMQPFVDSAISKTINCPEDISFESFRDIYVEAYNSGSKAARRTGQTSRSRAVTRDATSKTQSRQPRPKFYAAKTPAPKSVPEEAGGGIVS
jgi:ribonucleoside-diphosphate reductase alpha chain